jgi:hypothetical protein
MTTVERFFELLLVLLQMVVLLPVTYLSVLYLLEEDGPFDIFLRIRKLAGFKPVEYDELQPDGSTITVAEYEAGDNFWSRVLGCHRCLSPYVAFLVVLLGLTVDVLQPTPYLLIIWLGLAGSTVYFFEKGA